MRLIKLLLACGVSLSVIYNGNALVTDISKYYKEGCELKKDATQELRLIDNTCTQWVEAKRMYYAGYKADNGGWVNGCMLGGKYENWDESLKNIGKIIKYTLNKQKFSFDGVDWEHDSATEAKRNGYWMQEFVILSVSNINANARVTKKQKDLLKLKEDTLQEFYTNEELNKYSNTLHDMHSYIDTLDVFNMIATTMKVLMLMRQMPAYEKELNQKNNFKVNPIKQMNGYNNCYEASLLQIINALDPTQIDDKGLNLFKNIVSKYRDSNPKQCFDGFLDPRDAFKDEFEKVWKNKKGSLATLVNDLNESNKHDKSVNQLTDGYKKYLEAPRSSKKDIDTKHQNNANIKKVINTQKTQTKQSKNKTKALQINNDKLEYQVYRDNITDVLEDLIVEYTSKNGEDCLLTEEQKNRAEEIVAICKTCKLVHSKKQDTIGELLMQVQNYCHMYPQKLTDCFDGYYRKDVNKKWTKIEQEDFGNRVITPFFNFVSSVVSEAAIDSKNETSNSVYEDVNAFLDDFARTSYKDAFISKCTLRRLVTVEEFLDKIKNEWWTSWLEKSVKEKSSNDAFKKYLPSIRERYKEEIVNNFNKGNLKRQNVVDRLKKIMSDVEIPMETNGKEFKYKIPDIENLFVTLALIKKNDEKNIIERLNNDGFVLLTHDDIEKEIIKNCVRVVLKEYPKVILRAVENVNEKQSAEVANFVHNNEYIPVITPQGKILIYRLRGIANYVGTGNSGHYNASIYNGEKWVTVDSTEKSTPRDGKNRRFRPVFYACQQIYSE